MLPNIPEFPEKLLLVNLSRHKAGDDKSLTPLHSWPLTSTKLSPEAFLLDRDFFSHGVSEVLRDLNPNLSDCLFLKTSVSILSIISINFTTFCTLCMELGSNRSPSKQYAQPPFFVSGGSGDSVSPMGYMGRKTGSGDWGVHSRRGRCRGWERVLVFCDIPRLTATKNPDSRFLGQCFERRVHPGRPFAPPH